jgi:hypothetical protein
MQTLALNRAEILQIKKEVENLDNSLFIHYNYENIPIYDDTISIVMTSSNRSKQVYYTLSQIQAASFNHIHIIIVDDSDVDPLIKEYISRYAFHIDLIYINTENKKWINPVVNYNIGFQFIKGSKVVIQNSEVCHVGDVLGWISKYTSDNYYYSFDVRAVNSFESNEEIYKIQYLTSEIYSKDYLFKEGKIGWYHGQENITNYHFLTTMTRNTFQLINNFSYDYTFGKDWDDNDFLLKIKSKNINIVNLFHNIYNFGGIHLFHSSSYGKWKNVESNSDIYHIKLKEYNLKNIYIDFVEKINLNLINNRKFYITSKTNLLDLQNEILKFNSTNILLILDKNKITKEMNSFRKCLVKGYCYKNSGIKIPSTLNIKFLYEKINNI